MSKELEDAMKIVCKHLSEDEELYCCWQANIAVPFMDAYSRYCDGRNDELEYEDIHIIANNAARSFLYNLTGGKAS